MPFSRPAASWRSSQGTGQVLPYCYGSTTVVLSRCSYVDPDPHESTTVVLPWYYRSTKAEGQGSGGVGFPIQPGPRALLAQHLEPFLLQKQRNSRIGADLGSNSARVSSQDTNFSDEPTKPQSVRQCNPRLAEQHYRRSQKGRCSINH